MSTGEHEDYFESLEQQAHAARFGMWLFLASEVLLFGALFALFASYRVHFPGAFRECVEHASKVLGSVNTAVLLVSSTVVACSVHAFRAGRTRLASGLLAVTMTLGLAFLALKLVEWRQHFHDGIRPGGSGEYFAQHPARGFSEFWTLYFGMTGLHAVHVVIGLAVLGTMLVQILRGRLAPVHSHKLEIAAIYWHLVDLVWIFLWPLFYLA
ncbi:MAG: Cytochrome c oxidase polypeptide [Labilithrix sp.]|nr:Cytochrome c oxidase polypeptide [Labilithrix sp.]